MSEALKEQVQESEKPAIEPETESALDDLIDFDPDAQPEQSEQASQDVQSVAMAAMFYQGAFKVLANRLGDHWALSVEEAQALSEPTIAVMNKYLPNAKVGPEAALVGAAAVIVLPRILASTKPEKEPEKPDAKPDDVPEEQEGEQVYSGDNNGD